MPTWVVERLSDHHDRAGFSCGKPALDDFLKKLAGQYERRDFGRTFVAVVPTERAVLGYYTLAGGSVDLSLLPESQRKKLPCHPVPVAHLGRLAVAQALRGQGLGKFLLLNALGRCFRSSEEVALHAIEVMAIDEEARSFYSKYGFTPLADDPFHLYLAMKTVAKLRF